MNFISELRSILDFLKLYPDIGVIYDFWYILIIAVKTFLFSIGLSFIYKKNIDAFSSYFYHARSFFFITLSFSMVIVIINGNIMGAFSLIGALSLIRFRAVMKNSLDTSFFFLALIAGVSIPFKMSWIAWISLLMVFCGLEIYKRFIPSIPPKKNRLLKIVHNEKLKDIITKLESYKPRVRSSHLNGKTITSFLYILEDDKFKIEDYSKSEGICSLELL